jgi:hypothetical protein
LLFIRSLLRPLFFHTNISSDSALYFARALCVAADNLDTVGMDLVRVVELEVDVFDNEGPDVVTETVGIEVALQTTWH